MAITRRDETGRIVSGGVELSSEDAADLARRRWSNEKRLSQEELLREAGDETPTDAPQHLQLLAELSAGKKAGSVQALRDFRKLTMGGDTQTEPGSVAKVGPGEICPSCGQLVLGGVPVEKLKMLLDLMGEVEPFSKREREEN